MKTRHTRTHTQNPPTTGHSVFDTLMWKTIFEAVQQTSSASLIAPDLAIWTSYKTYNVHQSRKHQTPVASSLFLLPNSQPKIIKDEAVPNSEVSVTEESCNPCTDKAHGGHWRFTGFQGRKRRPQAWPISDLVKTGTKISPATNSISAITYQHNRNPAFGAQSSQG